MRVHSVDGKVVPPTMDVHNHAPSPTKNEARKIIINLKEESAETGKKTYAVNSKVYKNVSCGVSSVLLKTSLKRIVQRVCVQMEAPPLNPKFVLDLIISEEYIKTINEKTFLLYDSSTGNKFKILIFTTTENLYLMKSCDYWFCDGTFSVTPTLFSQVYIIHASRFSASIPTVFALLPDKSQATYIQMF